MTRSLDDYNRMRDFSATSEPAAGKRSGKKKRERPCLAVLHPEARGLDPDAARPWKSRVEATQLTL